MSKYINAQRVYVRKQRVCNAEQSLLVSPSLFVSPWLSEREALLLQSLLTNSVWGQKVYIVRHNEENEIVEIRHAGG